MRRSPLGKAALASLLLHAVFLALLWQGEPAVPKGRPASAALPLEVDLVFAAAPDPPPTPPPPPAAPPSRPRPKSRPAAPLPPPPAPATPLPEPPRPPTGGPSLDAPVAERSERAPVLLPRSLGVEGTVPVSPEPSRGRTLRPGDPSLSPEVLAAEEKARVGARVQAFAENELATLRVQNGLVDAYFGRIDTALEKQMEDAPLFGGQKGRLTRLAQAYQDEAARYGAGRAADAPVHERAAPSASQRFEALSRGNPQDNGMRAFMQAGESMQRLAEPPGGLVVILELQQAPDGQLRSVQVVESSGNPAFDAYVVDAVPPALAGLEPPAGKPLGVREDGIRSRWAVEGRVVYLRKLKDMKGQDTWYLATMAGLGVLSGRFEETTGDLEAVDLLHPRFVCRSRLLQVW
ncbi:TonB C terminal [Stigmatella aurantiaca]|uniref:TonB C terminal n=1 Tax=Stigmatella aurantiaca TaxID=41 RepID=A0A1H7Y090_STIAU|nr:TonB C-terminal domain-containing protein [Stigmatella aurantiaca]SEM39381.1 TonB C terminal [Stigmatella aurantiaca]